MKFKKINLFQYNHTLQLAEKKRTFELNSKFHKTYKYFFFKVFSQFDIKRKSQFICMTYNQACTIASLRLWERN